jgi:hypothetical protein
MDILLLGFLLLVVRTCFLLEGNLLLQLLERAFFLEKYPLHLDRVEDFSIGC